MSKARRVFVVGVGMTKFCKPQKEVKRGEPDYPDFAKVAVERALADACLDYSHVQAAVVGSAYGAKGQRCLYELGMTGIPIHNVSNACATGSNALYLARQFVASGTNDCCLALGIEQMKPGSLDGGGGKGASMMDHHFESMLSKFPLQGGSPPLPQMFGNAAREHMALYGSTARHFAMVGEKNHRHSVNNPYSQFQDVYDLKEVEKAPMVYEPITKLQCSPTSDGAACALVCSEEFVVRYGLEGQAVEIVGQSLKTDYPSAFSKGQPRTCIQMVGYEMCEKAAAEVFQQSGFGPNDVQVIELHDCFSANEIITYEALGLCKPGEGGKLIESGNTTFGGKWVVNPSGGLISKGHPLGATGIAQCAELTWQLRQEAGKRQVKNARVALQHNLGLGGACVITMYRRPDAWLKMAPKRAASLGAANLTSRL